MKKSFCLFALLIALSVQYAYAGVTYCRKSVQTSIDSWNIYIHRDGSGVIVPMEYRYSYIVSGLVMWSAWTALPSGTDIFVGGSGYGGGVNTIEVRTVPIGLPGSPPSTTTWTLSPC